MDSVKFKVVVLKAFREQSLSEWEKHSHQPAHAINGGHFDTGAELQSNGG